MLRAAFSEAETVPGLRLLRFAEPQPFRTVGLVKRASTVGEEWFDDLARVIQQVGKGIVERTRAEKLSPGEA